MVGAPADQLIETRVTDFICKHLVYPYSIIIWADEYFRVFIYNFLSVNQSPILGNLLEHGVTK